MRVSSLREHYDVVIVGGGLVGASFACALAAEAAARTGAKPMRILVTEPVAALHTSSSFDARSTALSYGSRCIYEHLGLWRELGPLATPIRNIHVSDRGHFGAVHIDSAEMGVAALGYVAENQHLGEVLTAALDHSPSIDFLCPAVIDELQPRPDGMAVRVQHGESSRAGLAPTLTTAVTEITATLVVLADGGKSILSERLGISGSVTHYGQKAIIANISFEKSHDNVAFERFTDSGPLAVLPLATLQGNHRGALVWTVAEHEADEILELPEPLFLQRLQERFGYRLGQIEKVGARVAYPLSLAVAREQVRPGLVLLGNVAHTLHPVAGQGLNLALRDSEVLAELLAAAYEQGESLGAMTVLQRYVDAQRRDQDATIDFSHYMTRLFSSGNPALIWARKFGLFSIDLIPVMKKTFARQAMGLAERRTRRV